MSAPLRVQGRVDALDVLGRETLLTRLRDAEARFDVASRSVEIKSDQRRISIVWWYAQWCFFYYGCLVEIDRWFGLDNNQPQI